VRRTIIPGFAERLPSGRSLRFHDGEPEPDRTHTFDLAIESGQVHFSEEDLPRLYELIGTALDECDRRRHWGRPAVEPHGQMTIGATWSERTCPGLEGQPRCGVELKRGQQLCAACNAAGAGGVSAAAKGIRAAG
jgi:hypothetical protein